MRRRYAPGKHTVWLTQWEMSELFDVSVDNIGLHLKNIYRDGELVREASAEESSVVQIEGARAVQRPLTRYNLDAILAVGYRGSGASSISKTNPLPALSRGCFPRLTWTSTEFIIGGSPGLADNVCRYYV